jgi:hypothetical protein
MADETAITTAVEKVVKASDPQTIASELAERIKPLLQSLDLSELETKHQIGVILNAKLRPVGQKRLPYGGKVMERLAEELDTARSTLNRTSQFASQYPTLADFAAKHPDVTTWSHVKKVLVKAKPANQHPTDLTRTHLQQCARSLATYLERFKKGLNGSHANLVSQCQYAAQELTELFQQQLSTRSTATETSPSPEPSDTEGDTQLESAALSTAENVSGMRATTSAESSAPEGFPRLFKR